MGFYHLNLLCLGPGELVFALRLLPCTIFRFRWLKDYAGGQCQILVSSGISSAVMKVFEKSWENYGKSVGKRNEG